MVKKAETKKQSIKHKEPAKRGTNFFDYLRFGESYTSLILGIIVVIIATALLLSFVHNKNTGSATVPNSQLTQNTVKITPQSHNLAKSVSSGDINSAVSIAPTAVPTAKPVAKATPKPTTKPTVAQTMKKKVAKAKPQPTKVPQVKTDKDNNVWIVQKGESLWLIAEKKYTSGYNWVDIAKANNLADPSNIHAGDKLVLPSVTPQPSTIATGNNTSNSSTSVQQNTTPGMTKITGKTYTVVKGDSLWDIAVRAYGDGYKWTAIAKANNLASPGLIFSGNKLIIPRG